MPLAQPVVKTHGRSSVPTPSPLVSAGHQAFYNAGATAVTPRFGNTVVSMGGSGLP